LERTGIFFHNQYEIKIFYLEEFIGIALLDFLIEESTVVELKAKPELEEAHFAQIFNYFEMGNFEFGLLINFGESRLNFKRITNKKYNSSKRKILPTYVR
jgi:GxxExxY protein